jgi:hypothetical protein
MNRSRSETANKVDDRPACNENPNKADNPPRLIGFGSKQIRHKRRLPRKKLAKTTKRMCDATSPIVGFSQIVIGQTVRAEHPTLAKATALVFIGSK